MNPSFDMVWSLLALSALGLLGLSVLWSALAYPLYRIRNRLRGRILAESKPPSFIEIVIPAHNEAQSIDATLTSLQRAVQVLQQQTSNPPRILVHVGADRCTDRTIQVAQRFPGVLISEYPQHGSKWLTLKAMCSRSDSDWTILVDSGTIWPENLLKDMFHEMVRNPQAVGLSPSYQPLMSGRIDQIIWHLEQGLKRLEMSCGGPVSVHGATVAYQTTALKRVFAELGTTTWLNDDVVLPLMIRALFPDQVLLYPVGHVLDAGVQRDKRGLQRRRRILMGNLQWAGGLLPRVFRLNPFAGLIAMRRLFRVLWAYWALFVAASIAAAFHQTVPALLILAAVVFLSRSGRDLAGAALVSLLTPFRLLQLERQVQEAWK